MTAVKAKQGITLDTSLLGDGVVTVLHHSLGITEATWSRVLDRYRGVVPFRASLGLI